MMNKKWFKAQFKKVGKPQSTLARKLNVEPSAVSRALNGLRRFKADEVPIIADFFSVSVEEVLTAIDGQVPTPSSRSLPGVAVIGQINTSSGGIVECYNQHSMDSYCVSFKLSHDMDMRKLVGLTVRHDFHKLFREGDDLIFALVDVNIHAAQGKTVLYEKEYHGNKCRLIGRVNILKDGLTTLIFDGVDIHHSRECVYKSSSPAGGTLPLSHAMNGDKIEILGVLVKSIRNE